MSQGKWYVINGDDNGIQRTDMAWAESYSEIIASYKELYPNITCINVDLLTPTTRISYGLTVSFKEIV